MGRGLAHDLVGRGSAHDLVGHVSAHVLVGHVSAHVLACVLLEPEVVQLKKHENRIMKIQNFHPS